MATKRPDWRAMADLVVARRAELGLTQDQFIEQMDEDHRIGVETFRRVEAGDQQTYRRTTLTAVSLGLGLPASALWDEAHEPGRFKLEPRVVQLEADVTEIREMVRKLARRRANLGARP